MQSTPLPLQIFHKSTLTRSNHSNDEKIRRINNFLNDRENNKLIFLLNKSIRYKNHVAIAKIHINKRTTPNTLFYNRFPRPLFPYDVNFINKYNIIIENFQKETLSLMNETVENELKIIDTEIISLKEGFLNKFSNSPFSFEEVVDHGLKVKAK